MNDIYWSYTEHNLVNMITSCSLVWKWRLIRVWLWGILWFLNLKPYKRNLNITDCPSERNSGSRFRLILHHHKWYFRILKSYFIQPTQSHPNQINRTWVPKTICEFETRNWIHLTHYLMWWLRTLSDWIRFAM